MVMVQTASLKRHASKEYFDSKLEFGKKSQYYVIEKVLDPLGARGSCL
jgi:hypothetical protein